MMRLSAQNKLVGRVMAVEKGLINASVKLDLGNGQIVTSVISRTSLEEMQIDVGKVAIAIIKSTDVIIGMESV